MRFSTATAGEDGGLPEAAFGNVPPVLDVAFPGFISPMKKFGLGREFRDEIVLEFVPNLDGTVLRYLDAVVEGDAVYAADDSPLDGIEGSVRPLWGFDEGEGVDDSCRIVYSATFDDAAEAGPLRFSREAFVLIGHVDCGGQGSFTPSCSELVKPQQPLFWFLSCGEYTSRIRPILHR